MYSFSFCGGATIKGAFIRKLIFVSGIIKYFSYAEVKIGVAYIRNGEKMDGFPSDMSLLQDVTVSSTVEIEDLSCVTNI